MNTTCRSKEDRTRGIGRNAGVGHGERSGKMDRNEHTFLLLLLISACGSLRRPSSEGGVAELDSFFGRATGMGGKKSQQAERADGALEGNGTVCLAF